MVMLDRLLPFPMNGNYEEPSGNTQAADAFYTRLMRSIPTYSGFTLIEMLVTVVIAGVLAAVAIPNLQSFLVTSRQNSNVNNFVGIINYARSEAITRNQDVVICPKSPTAETCISTQFWNENDLLVFVDADRNSQKGSDDTVLRTFPAMDPTGTVTRFNRTTSANQVIGIASSGFSAIPLRFNIYPPKSGDTAYEYQYGRSVCISKPGRVRVIPFSTNDCGTF